MSDDQVYGERTHGYASEPMFPKPDPEPGVEDGEGVSVEAMAVELADKWRNQGLTPNSEKPLIDRGYKTPSGDPVEPDRIVTVQENAKALGAAYERDAAQQQQQHQAALAEEIDHARLEFNMANDPELAARVEALQQQPQEAQQLQPEPQQQQQSDPVDELAKAWQATPGPVKKALEAQVAEIQKAQQSYVDASAEQARFLARSVFESFPELIGRSQQEAQAIVNAYATSNPERAAAIQAKVHDALLVAQAAEQAAAQQRQQQQQANRTQWQQYQQAEDKKFDEKYPEYADAKSRVAIADAVVKTAENAGISKENLLKSYTGQLQFDTRSAAVQEILLKAALYDQAKAGVAHADKPLNVPPVQRPGAWHPSSGDDGEIAALTRRVAKTGSLKDATALRLAKLRANRG